MKKFLKATASVLAALIAASSFGVIGVSAAAVSAPKLKAVNTTSGVKLSWNKGTGAGKFIVARRASGAKSYSTVATVGSSAVTFTDKKAKAGVQYAYKVTAINGNAAAIGSASIRFLKAPSTVKANVVTVDERDSSVAGIFDFGYYGKFAKIKWSKSAGAEKYRVYRAKVSGSTVGKYTAVKTTKKTAWIDYDSTGKYFKYKVAAMSGKTRSALSASTPKLLCLDTPELAVKKNSDYTGFELRWIPVTGAKKYSIYRSVGGGKYTLLKSSANFKKKTNDGTIMLLSDKVFYYEDTKVKLREGYKYYVVAETGKYKSAAKKSNTAIMFVDYDYAFNLGANDNLLTQVVNFITTMTGPVAKLSISSSDSNVLKITKGTDSDGNTKFAFEGVSAGDAFVTVKSTVDYGYGQKETTTTKYKVRVLDTPAYDVKLNVGDVISPGDIQLGELQSFFGMLQSALVISSSDPNVIKVTKKSTGYTIKAMSEGYCELVFKPDTSNIPKEMLASEEVKALTSLKFTIRVYVEK